MILNTANHMLQKTIYTLTIVCIMYTVALYNTNREHAYSILGTAHSFYVIVIVVIVKL